MKRLLILGLVPATLAAQDGARTISLEEAIRLD